MAIEAEPEMELISGYRLIERLGRGSYGEVWKASAPGGFLKAIKLVFGNVTGGEGQAAEELDALARIRDVRHPYILTIERFDIVKGQLVIVMELADRNLEDRLRECQRQGLPGIPRLELLKYLSEAAEALDLMNEEYGLQHLDIKPANLFLIRSHLKVADFGVVKDLAGGSASKLIGGTTPAYGSPETVRGWFTRFSDQYSLAIVYQEMLTGQLPFVARTMTQMVMMHAEGEPDLSSLPARDRPIMRKALSKTPEERHGSCTEFVQLLFRAGQPEVGRSKSLSMQAMLAEAAAVKTGSTLPTSTGQSLVEAEAPIECDLLDSVPPLNAPGVPCMPSGTLVPTLVIGLGSMGLRACRMLGVKFAARYGHRENWPPVRLLGLDTDTESMRRLPADPTKSFGEDSVLFCPLQPATEYTRKDRPIPLFTDWVLPAHLSAITHHGAANGHRALGRLALFDNLEPLVHRINHEFQQLLLPDNLEKALASTGQMLRSTTPRVYVIASMGGGTGSGIFIDLCYILRRILASGGVTKADVQGILLAGIAVNAHDRDLRRANHYALGQDLLLYSQPDTTFSAKYHASADLGQFRCAPAETFYYFDMIAEHLPEPRDEVVLDTVVEFIRASVTRSLGSKLEQSERSEQLPLHRGLGWFSVIYPTEILARVLAQRLVDTLVAGWTGTITTEESNRVLRAIPVQACLDAYKPENISEQLLKVANARLGEPIDQKAMGRLQLLDDELRKMWRGSTAEPCRATLRDLARMLGSPIATDTQYRSPFDEALLAARDTLQHSLRGLLPDLLSGFADQSGARLERTEAVLKYCSLERVDLIDKYMRTASTHIAKMITTVQTTRDRLMAGGSRAKVVQQFEDVITESITYKIAATVHEMYQTLRQELFAQGEQLTSECRALEAFLKGLQRKEDAPELSGSGGSVCQMFPDGAVGFKDAVTHLLRKLVPQRIDDLDQRIQQTVLDPMGGLWGIRRDPSRRNEVATGLMTATIGWIAETLPQQDIARIFLDVYGADESTRKMALETCFLNAKPSISGRATKAATALPVRDVTFLSTPNSPTGEEFQVLFNEYVTGADPTIFTDREECCICRIAYHPSLGQLLPLWLLQGKIVYEAACQGSLPPTIFTAARQ